MNLADVVHGAAKAQVEAYRKDRTDHKERSEASDIKKIYASELGHCPLYLYQKLCGKKERNSPSRVSIAFLEDGLMHEDELRRLIQKFFPTLDLYQSTSTMRDKVPGTDIEVSGRLDITFKLDGKPVVIEAKAVKTDTFKMYQDARNLIPKWYYAQLAWYMYMLKAEEGMLIIKDRNTSEFIPDLLSATDVLSEVKTLKWATEGVQNIYSTLKAMNEGFQPDTGMAIDAASLYNECRFCSFPSLCFPSDKKEETEVENRVLTITDETKEAFAAAAEIERMLAKASNLAGIIKSNTAVLDMLYASIKTALTELGKSKAVWVGGSAVILPQTTRTYPDNGVVKRLVSEGVVPTRTVTIEEALRLYPKKGAKKDEEAVAS